MNLKPALCFLLLHTILLHSMIDFGSAIAFNAVLTKKTNNTVVVRLSYILTNLTLL